MGRCRRRGGRSRSRSRAALIPAARRPRQHQHRAAPRGRRGRGRGHGRSPAGRRPRGAVGGGRLQLLPHPALLLAPHRLERRRRDGGAAPRRGPRRRRAGRCAVGGRGRSRSQERHDLAHASRASARSSPTARTPTTCCSPPRPSSPTCSASSTAASRRRHDDDRILPIVHRDGSVRWGPTPWESERWGLPDRRRHASRCGPTGSADRPVRAHGPGRPARISAEQLAKAVALVDQAGAALARRPASA